MNYVWRRGVGGLLGLAMCAAGAASVRAAENADAKVLTKMHMVNQMEIQAGELAQQKAQSEEVRNFGEQLAEAHRDSDEQVQSVAREAGIPLTEPDVVKKKQAEQQQLMDKLQKAQGADFDKEFTKAMTEGHDETIDALMKDRAQLTHPEVRNLVDKTLPKLQEHYQHAQRLQQVAR